MNKILLIGCGHMGEALLKAWIKNNKDLFFIVDPIKYKKINKTFNTKIVGLKSIDEFKDFRLIDIVIFAIKPQVTRNTLEILEKKKFKKNVIFVSIVAGKKINFYNKYLPNKNQFIRVMPNMPAVINKGMSCLVANQHTSNKNKNIIESLFLNVGKVMWLRKENDINKVTAISGSGPGYIFLFIDAFEKAAMQLGLGERVTKELVHQTIYGSINLLLSQKENASILVKNIAVKGGTTEAGLNEFNKKNILYKSFKKAIEFAYKRANKLGK